VSFDCLVIVSLYRQSWSYPEITLFDLGHARIVEGGGIPFVQRPVVFCMEDQVQSLPLCYLCVKQSYTRGPVTLVS
jgi:hypothetical protein